MKISEIMTHRVKTISPESRLVEAARLMRDEDTGAIPVVDQDRPVGILTDRDIVIRAVAEGRSIDECQVRDAMTETVLHVSEDADVRDAVEQMKSNQVRRIVVLDDQRKVCGIVSLADIARRMGQDRSGEVLKQVSDDQHREPGKQVA
jgi:CBS domain-containing protein